MSDFEVFKSFYSEEQALDLQQLLTGNGIATKIEKKRAIADKVFTGDAAEAEIYLMLKGSDFPKANQVIDEWVSNNLSAIDTDYYLFSFSTEELIDIIKKPDEWNNQDVILARTILADRGHYITDRETEQVKEQRIKELIAPDKESSSLILLGYVVALFLPVYGIFFAVTKLTAKKVLPDGNKVFIYNESARNHFRVMMGIGIILVLFLFRLGFDFLFPVPLILLQLFI